MNINIIKIPESGYSSNCYIIHSKENKEAVIIDPGAPADHIIKILEDEGLDLKKIILTHGHADHIASVEELRDRLNIEVLIHEDDQELLENPDLNFSNQMLANPVAIKANRLLKDGDEINLEDMKFKVIHTPGHTKGGICLVFGNIIITGDTLFAGSIGRTDFYGGDFDTIINSIKEKLFIYPDDTIILPGHGEVSNIGIEKQTNPFLR